MAKSVKCEWCNKLMSITNIVRHQNKGGCLYKNELEMKKDDFLKLKESFINDEEKKEDEDLKEIQFLKMKRFITESFVKFKEVNDLLSISSLKTPLEKINELHIKDSTRQNYILECSLYTKWLKKSKNVLGVDSANTYLASLKCKGSTLMKKIGILQQILKIVIDPTVKLNQYKSKVQFKKKAVLDEAELNEYLEEQKTISSHDYILQLIMATYGLRVSSVAALKLKNISLENRRGAKIIIPEIKTNTTREEIIDPKLKQELKSYYDQNKHLKEEDYLFLPKLQNRGVSQRASQLGILINKRLKESKSLQKDPNYAYTSHLFRKSSVFTEYRDAVEKLKKKARAKIGQAPNSSAITHYIN